PKWNEEVTFTPVDDIEDPDWDINKATFRWDFGDGHVTQRVGPQAVKHTYGKEGSYTVTLEVIDQGGARVERKRTLKIHGLEVDFRWSPQNPRTNQEVTFTADPEQTSPPTFVYSWNFGDGTVLAASENNRVVKHTFGKKGTYTVVLTVKKKSDGSIVGTAKHTIEVLNDPPEIHSLTWEPEEPEVKDTVTFSATASDPEGDEITDWQWDFDGDGAVDSTQAPPVTYTYERDGIYTVKVRAKDAGSGSWGEWYQEKTIYVRPKGGPEVGLYVLRNPARTQATLRIFLPQGATNAVLYIYDLLGHLILQREVSGGEFRWDLTDENDVLVPSGLYFALVVAEKDGKPIRSRIGRILVIRQGG
ncbi:PKD domain-containing protein, partial [Candidatus Bipolaricaulota bacterium]|nr:PKD domain-containing protein [Candidatus Bipolaricaulota bacterium]